MAAKISTLILTVDLQCYICTKKIKKTIFKLQAREPIQTVTYDEKNNTITISGLFDPQKLKKKLLCKACKEIKEIKIKEEEKKPPAQKETKPPEPEKPKITQPDKPKEPEKPKPPPVEQPKEKPKEAEKEKPKEKPKEPEKEKPKPEPVQESQPVWPVGPPLPSCCWRPCYEHYYGGCRCCSCGMFFGPPGAGCMGGPSTSTCQFICEEDPSCTIM